MGFVNYTEIAEDFFLGQAEIEEIETGIGVGPGHPEINDPPRHLGLTGKKGGETPGRLHRPDPGEQGKRGFGRGQSGQEWFELQAGGGNQQKHGEGSNLLTASRRGGKRADESRPFSANRRQMLGVESLDDPIVLVEHGDRG